MREIPLVSAICYFIVRQAELYRERIRRNRLINYGLNPDKITKNVDLVNLENIKIGSNTYMNSGSIVAGETAKVIIGDWCTIGYNVHIRARTHDPNNPTGPKMRRIEKDIIIGNNVWIGNNVYIKEGVKIGDNVIIGANSVVTKDIEDNAVVGGNPAKILYFRNIRSK